MEYLDIGYVPRKEDLICEYYLEPNKISFERACQHIAAESSIGTWTDVQTMRRDIAKRLAPHIFWINKKKKLVRIAYPSELFEPGNMPQILSSIAGNVFGMKILKNLRLIDIGFPMDILESFHGPRYGIHEIKKSLNVVDRPLLGTIIKPKVGLDSTMHAQTAYNAWIGGCDFVKDDENLTDQHFNPFGRRVVKTLKKREQAEKYTGERKAYLPNITAETREMIRRAKFVKRCGGEFVMVDVFTVGISALQTLRNLDLGLAIHAHRAMHAALTRNKKHGISMLAFSKIFRLIGVDSLHIGTAVGKMEGKAADVLKIESEIEGKMIKKYKEVLMQEWNKIKPVLAVCSGGLHPALIPKLIRIMGKDILIQAGGGIHGHPDGTTAGARAMRQAIFATQINYQLREYAQISPELKKALEKWGGR